MGRAGPSCLVYARAIRWSWRKRRGLEARRKVSGPSGVMKDGKLLGKTGDEPFFFLLLFLAEAGGARAQLGI